MTSTCTVKFQTVMLIIPFKASLTVFGIIGFKSLLSSSSCFYGYLQGLMQTQNDSVSAFMSNNDFQLRKDFISRLTSIVDLNAD